MTSPLSIKYIEHALQKGYGRDQIKRSLQAQGFTEADIEAAFSEVNKKQETQPQAQPQVQNQPPSQAVPTPEEKPKVEQKIPSIWAQPASPSSQGGSQPRQSVESRMQYRPKSSGRWVWLSLVVLVLVALGAGAALYFVYPEQLERFGFSFNKPSEETPIFPEPVEPEPIDCTMDVKVCPDGSSVGRIPPSCEFKECPEPSLSLEEIKMVIIEELRVFLGDYLQKYGVYPEKITDSDVGVFYCFRKEGQHYVLGTVLEPDDSALADDLDGSYYCGDAVKDCSDPVYCVGPK